MFKPFCRLKHRSEPILTADLIRVNPRIKNKNLSSELTSNGNMVSPPFLTSDKYNKKDATCAKIDQAYEPRF